MLDRLRDRLSGRRAYDKLVERRVAQARTVPDPRIRRAAEALAREWPSLGIVSRAVVYNQPSHSLIASVALEAADREDAHAD